MDIKIDVTKEKEGVSTEIEVTYKNLKLAFPDDNLIKTLGDNLIKGLVAAKVYKSSNPKFKLHHIKVRKLFPLKHPRNISSAMFAIVFINTKMPEGYSILSNDYPRKDEKGIEFYEWRFGPDKKTPDYVVSMSFYPYNFPFLKKYIRIPQKRILIKWDSVVVN